MQKTMIKLSLCGAVAGLALLLPAGLARAGEAPAAGRPWKMLLAPPRMLTRSVERKVPPAPV